MIDGLRLNYCVKSNLWLISSMHVCVNSATSVSSVTASATVFRFGLRQAQPPFSALDSAGSATVFRFGFGRLSHRGKTAFDFIQVKLVQSCGGSMAVAEPVEATIKKSLAITVMIKCLITQCGKAWLIP